MMIQKLIGVIIWTTEQTSVIMLQCGYSACPRQLGLGKRGGEQEEKKNK